MKLTLLVYEFTVPGCQSLKEKRKVVKGLKESLRSHFNLSIAEVDYQDKWQRSTIAIALVAEASHNIENTISAIDTMINKRLMGNIIRTERNDLL